MTLFCYTVPKLERGLCPPCVCKLVVFFTLLTGLSLSLHGNTHVHTCTHTHTHIHTHTTDGYVARLQAALNSTGLPQDQPLRTQSANVHKAARQTICILESTTISFPLACLHRLQLPPTQWYQTNN